MDKIPPSCPERNKTQKWIFLGINDFDEQSRSRRLLDIYTANLAHLDIKSHNIVIDDQNNALIIDFGRTGVTYRWNAPETKVEVELSELSLSVSTVRFQNVIVTFETLCTSDRFAISRIQCLQKIIAVSFLGFYPQPPLYISF